MIESMKWAQKQKGFTIVELLIVVVVIAILAAITIVSYNGISARAHETTVKSDLSSAVKQLQVEKVNNDSYPANVNGVKKSENVSFQYSRTQHTFCLTAITTKLPGKAFHATESGLVETGVCPGHSTETIVVANGMFMQHVTSDNCPLAETWTVDARDSNTYWVQKLADGNCWMLTNLAYAGGGTNTFGDTVSLANGGTNPGSYTAGLYYVPAGANVSFDPFTPSTSMDGTGQYGHLYNWCAATGVQGTAGCQNATAPAPDAAVSVCPAGWRLPVADGENNEFVQLNNAINSGLTNTTTGLRTAWLAQYSGYWAVAIYGLGNNGNYWSSTQASANSAYYLNIDASHVYPESVRTKSIGHAVRCLTKQS